MIVSAKNLMKAFGTDTVLENVTFSIEEGEKAAFVGVNGAGKTTLFRIISGEMSRTDGEIMFARDATVSYLAQSVEYESDLTIHDEMLEAFSDVIETERKIREIEAKMSEADDISAISTVYNELLRYYESNDGYSYKSLIRGVIAGLGLGGADIAERKISELSGGQKTRAALGKALLKKPDLLLLDEPTNHLDVESVGWLEGFLKSYPKTVLLISHDRFFMDAVVSKVVEIDRGRSTVYKGNYSEFVSRKSVNDELAWKRYKDVRKEIEKQEEAIRQLRSFNRQKSVRRAESMEKRLRKLDTPEKPKERADISIKLSPKHESGFDVLSVSAISKSYGSNEVLKDISFEIKRGERVALIGANGIGKSTLLNIITGRVPADSGRIRHGANVRVGFYDQERKSLDEAKTVFSQLHDAFPRLTEGEVRNVLASFLFRGDDAFKLIKTLSGGEKGRVSLALLMLSGANLLILDEPTNHLDTFSREILENSLIEYGGTYLCVSHDRYFINRTATRVLELTENGIKSYCGDYDYYRRKKADEETDDTQVSAEKHQKNDWLRKKQQARAQRKKTGDLEQLEGRISETELKIRECDELLCDPSVYTSPERLGEICRQKASHEQALEKLYEEWAELDGC